VQPDGTTVFAQPGFYPGGTYPGHLLPFHLDTRASGSTAECTNDISHTWGSQQRAWNGGLMNGFVSEHIAANGTDNGPLTMGYYNRADLDFYYALADAFTICDAYHCSVIGPTDPNRLYTMSATLDPDGKNGGPLLETLVTDRPQEFGKLTWKTMPEVLQEAGVSWKVYQTPDGQADDVLLYFKAFNDPSSPLFRNAFVPTYPGTFEADVLAGALPAVSWVLAPVAQSEHPSAPPEYGEDAVHHVLSSLVANPAVWEKTALFVTYDENGGFFDHVPPPTPPAGTPGEFLTVDPLPAAAEGIRGPIGLGFRVPMLVVSPYSRGGFMCSDTFDHTSMLRFLETRFGAEVPNLSAWRRSVTGDLTSAFDFAGGLRPDVPTLPTTSLADPVVLSECVPGGVTGLDDLGPVYPVPPNGDLPAQEPGSAPAPSGPVPGAALRAHARR
jgi:phospholipase C